VGLGDYQMRKIEGVKRHWSLVMSAYSLLVLGAASQQAVEQQLVQSPPHAHLVPVVQTTPTGHPRTALHLLGQHLPGNATFEHE
jgi:hypothetical protein